MIKNEVRDRVAFIELSRPEKKNALTAEMYAALADALEHAGSNAEVRAVLLRGTRDCFTAGNDLQDFLQRPPGAASPTWKFFEVLPALEKPVVAAVNGPAVGIGTTLLLHCDLVYAAPAARFQLPFVPLGVVPEFGSTFLLPLLAGYQRAAELLLLGQPFTADKAMQAGIVTEVVPEEGLVQKAEAAAAALAALPRESLRLTKRLMKARYAVSVRDAIREESGLFVERLASGEAREAMTAFLEKRKPDFSKF
ncbi:MAG: enoyl-CoA hydratase [Betaproteobacteria bacterium]